MGGALVVLAVGTYWGFHTLKPSEPKPVEQPAVTTQMVWNVPLESEAKAQKIEKKLAQTPGVVAVKTTAKTVTCEYDPTKVQVADMVQTIEKEGVKVESKPSAPQPLNVINYSIDVQQGDPK